MERATSLSASLLLDEQGRVIDGNRDAEILLGCPLEEARKMPLDRLNPLLHQVLKDLLEKARRGKGVENYSFAYKLGRRLTRLMATVTPYPLEALGSVGTLVTVKGEAAARRPAPQAEEERKGAVEVKGGLQGFLQMLPEPSFILDEEGNFIFANRAFCDFIGHPLEDILGRPLSFFLGRRHAPGTQERLLEASLLSPWRGELQLQRADGSRGYLRATCALLPGEGQGGSCFLFLTWECGDEVRLRREREGEIKRLWRLLDATGLGMVAFTPDRRITAFNQVAEKALGTGREVAIGALLEEVLPVDGETMAGLIKEAKENESATFTIDLPGGADGREARYHCTVRGGEGGDPGAPEMIILMEPVAGGDSAEERRLSTERWWAERFYSHYLENMIRKGDEVSLYERVLGAFRDEGAAEAGLAFLVREGGLREVAGYGLELREKEKLSELRLKRDAMNLWTFSPFLEVHFQAGVPRRGWDEARTLLENPEPLSWLAGERRWKRLIVLPVGRKKTDALLLLGEPRADLDELLAMVRALDEARARASGLQVEVGSERQAASPESRSAARPARAEKPRPSRAPHGLTLLPSDDEPEDGRNPLKMAVADASGAEVQEELLYKAMKAKGDDSAEEIPLWHAAQPSRPNHALDLEDFSRRLRERIQQHYGPAVLFEIEEGLPLVHLDAKVLEELVLGLVEDAVDASPPGKPVVFGVERWGDEVLFRVEDQGACLVSGPRGDEVTGGGEASDLGAHGQAELTMESRETRLGIYRQMASKIRGSLTWKSCPGEGNVVYLRVGLIPFVDRAEA